MVANTNILITTMSRTLVRITYLLKVVRIFCGTLRGDIKRYHRATRNAALYEGLKSGPYGRSYGWLSFSWRVQYLMIRSTFTALSSATNAYD